MSQQSTSFDKHSLKHAAAVIALMAFAALVVIKIDLVVSAVSLLIGVLAPFITGAVIAYLVNLVMSRLEKVFFPKTSSKVVVKLRRPLCLLLSFVLIVGVLSLIISLISAEMAKTFPALLEGTASMLQGLQSWLASSGTVEQLENWGLALALPENSSSWQETLKALVDKFGGMGGIASKVFSAGVSVGGTVVNIVVAAVFAIYLLAGKERAHAGAHTLVGWLFPEAIAEKVRHAASVANECFSQFIMGQCIEGCILGTLCGIGMAILGLPYPAAIGACVGLTSLIPMVGAWIGAIVGVLMIFSVDPIQAVWFVIFLLILQQVEGNLIYPFVVGSSVGVPGIWVLVAIFVGGALFGVVGILLGVPVVATVRRLIADWRPDKPAELGPPDVGSPQSQPAPAPAPETAAAEGTAQ